ncbi:MAG: TetR family transcriptional regulator C-terminal domain-containing protein [Acidimicrobiia bacterium]|nr:TetR family transcriptional regulator C-terminal domain-containing protein [Acidimicrobiia bacterium]
MPRMSPQLRRQAIVDATLAVALRKGLATTTVRDVAAEMGSSSGLVHHYFDSMDDVLAAAFEQAAGGDLEAARAKVAEVEDPAGRLIRFLQTYSPAQSDWTMQLWLDAWSEAARRPALQQASRRLNLEWHALIREIIDAGVRDGSFVCDDSNAAGWRLLSVLDGLALQVVAHDSVITRHDVLSWVTTAAELELSLPAPPGLPRIEQSAGQTPARRASTGSSEAARNDG